MVGVEVVVGVVVGGEVEVEVGVVVEVEVEVGVEVVVVVVVGVEVGVEVEVVVAMTDPEKLRALAKQEVAGEDRYHPDGPVLPQHHPGAEGSTRSFANAATNERIQPWQQPTW